MPCVNAANPEHKAFLLLRISLMTSVLTGRCIARMALWLIESAVPSKRPGGVLHNGAEALFVKLAIAIAVWGI